MWLKNISFLKLAGYMFDGDPISVAVKSIKKMHHQLQLQQAQSRVHRRQLATHFLGQKLKIKENYKVILLVKKNIYLI